MKYLHSLLLSLLLLHSASGQIVEWSHQFDVHSSTALGGLSTNAQLTQDGGVIIPVVEDDELVFYKFDQSGNLSASLPTDKRSGIISRMIEPVPDNFLLLFDNAPGALKPSYTTILIDANLQVNDEVAIPFDFSGYFTLSSVFTSPGGQVFFTTFYGGDHYLHRFNQDGTLDVLYSGDAKGALQDEVRVLESGNFLFAFRSGADHRIMCVSPDSGDILWDRVFGSTVALNLEYRIISGDDETIVFAGLERSWQDGDQQDVLLLRRLGADHGEIQKSSTFEACIRSFEDIRFHPAGVHFYVVLANCFPTEGFTVLKLDGDFNLMEHRFINAVADPNAVPVADAGLALIDDGSVALVYRAYKNSGERGNIFVTWLDNDLHDQGTIDLDFGLGSGESFTDIIVDDERIVVTGFIPDSDPFISWEAVQYFLAVFSRNTVSGSADLRAPDIAVYPNPAKDFLIIGNKCDAQTGYEVSIFAALGTHLGDRCVRGGKVDVADMIPGVYFMRVPIEGALYCAVRFVKQ